MTNHSGENQSSAPYRNTRWCEMLRSAASSVTRDELAKRVGFSRAKVQNILGGKTKPTMDDLVSFADTLQLSKLRLLDAAGYLEGISNLLTYLDQLEEQAELMEHATRRLAASPYPGATQIAGAALAAGDFDVIIRPDWLGTGERRRHYQDRVILTRRDGADMSTVDRQRIEVRLRDELAWFHSGFIDGWPGAPKQLAINVPRFLALRHSSGEPVPMLPRSIAVIGGHWAGSADVASFLAYAFDYDYAHVAFTASRTFSRLTHDWRNYYRERDRLEVTRTYVEGSAIGRQRVWAADVGDSEEAVRILGTSRSRKTPFIISLRPTDDLLEWTAHARSRWQHTDDDAETDLRKIRAARARVDQALEPLTDKTQILEVPLPAPNTFDRRTGELRHDGDAWFDMWMMLSEHAIHKLHARHGIHFNKDAALAKLRAGGISHRP
jgi:transcriptional regulator with XRE-family HTH domain